MKTVLLQPKSGQLSGVGGGLSATNLQSPAPGARELESPFFENQLLTYKQAAQYLSLSEPYLRKLKARGEIPYVVVGSRAVRFCVRSLDKWIEDREVK